MDVLITLAISIGVNVFMFIPAYFFRTDKLTDISYALTFVLVVWWAAITTGLTVPTFIVAAMVTLWAARLGAYLLIRIQKMGKDARFDKMRENFIKFAGFWLLQGFTVWVVLLPSTLFIFNQNTTVPAWAFIGVVIWLIGLLVETFADIQLFKFIMNPLNKGKWIDEGLWHYSRHPNYFGEISLWAGVYLFAIYGLVGTQIFFGLVGPLYITGLIGFVSGIPILEKSADKRWGKNPAYRAYKARTSILIPLPSKKKISIH